MPIVSADDLRDVLRAGGSVDDATLLQISATAEAAFLRYLKKNDANGNAIDYSVFPEIHEGITSVAVDFFGARTAPGGQSSGLDFAPAPRINAFIVQRAVQSYALHHMDAGSFFA